MSRIYEFLKLYLTILLALPRVRLLFPQNCLCNAAKENTVVNIFDSLRTKVNV